LQLVARGPTRPPGAWSLRLVAFFFFHNILSGQVLTNHSPNIYGTKLDA